ncbi:hypothetical protein [Polaribacter aestuariivivens]|uniref:hypothetical protein n=1 Tax=Polaribacter aestuariivivens TaxID=2304626 RepID=UPI003F49A905
MSNKSTEKEGNNNISGQSALRFILTFLFTYVLTVYMSSYDIMTSNIKALTYFEENTFFDLIIVHSFVGIFGINLFRMLHGFVKLLFSDLKLNNYGGTIDSSKELVWVLLLILCPLVSIKLISEKGPIELNQFYMLLKNTFSIDITPFSYLILSLSIPSFLYLIYDLFAFYSLYEDENKDDNEGFISHLYSWIILDALIIISSIMSILIGVNNYSLTLFLYSIITFGIIIADYRLNKKYYF